MTVALRPTEAYRKGTAAIAMCLACGTLVCFPVHGDEERRGWRRRMGACSWCGATGQWREQRLPVGPFVPAEGQ